MRRWVTVALAVGLVLSAGGCALEHGSEEFRAHWAVVEAVLGGWSADVEEVVVVVGPHAEGIVRALGPRRPALLANLATPEVTAVQRHVVTPAGERG